LEFYFIKFDQHPEWCRTDWYCTVLYNQDLDA